VLTLCFSSVACAQTWEWQNLVPTGNDLYGVFFTDALIGWVIGDAGIIRSTTNGGINWTGHVSGTKNALRGINFVNSI
jgi:photosystem II stability/assembly factor-like uncharacterized protein